MSVMSLLFTSLGFNELLNSVNYELSECSTIYTIVELNLSFGLSCGWTPGSVQIEFNML